MIAVLNRPSNEGTTAEGASGPDQLGKTALPGPPSRRADSVLAFARQHWLFLLLFVAGAALRAVTSFAYQPALLRRDSVGYLLHASLDLEPPAFHPIAYPAFLRLFPLEDHLGLVPLVQHLLGLGIAVLVYVLLLRLGVHRWLAALAAAPVLLDAYQINNEHYVLSETLFEVFLAAGCALLLWRRPLGLIPASLAGLVFAAAALTRTAGVFVLVPALLAAVFLSDPRWRLRLVRAGALLALFVLPLVAYAAWFHSVHGAYGLTSYGGRILYGRVFPFADCANLDVPGYERVLCPRQPPGQRPTANESMWSRKLSPVYRVEAPSGMTRNDVAGDFAARIIRHQPLDYARAVTSDFVRSFAPTKVSRRDDVPLGRWQFQRRYRIAGEDRRWADSNPLLFPSDYGSTRADPRSASFLQRYQRFGYAPGPFLGIGLVVGLLAAVGVGRARGSGLRSAAFLFSSVALALILGSVAVALFNWRYMLPQLVLLPPALAIGVTALTGTAAARAPTTATTPNPPEDVVRITAGPAKAETDALNRPGKT